MNALGLEDAVRALGERPEVSTVAFLYRPHLRVAERWLVQVVNDSLPIVEAEGSTAFEAVCALMARRSSEQAANQLLKRVTLDDPLVGYPECCAFCDRQESRERWGSPWVVVHAPDCPWVAAMVFLGRELGPKHRVALLPRPEL